MSAIFGAVVNSCAEEQRDYLIEYLLNLALCLYPKQLLPIGLAFVTAKGSCVKGAMHEESRLGDWINTVLEEQLGVPGAFLGAYAAPSAIQGGDRIVVATRWIGQIAKSVQALDAISEDSLSGLSHGWRGAIVGIAKYPHLHLVNMSGRPFTLSWLRRAGLDVVFFGEQRSLELAIGRCGCLYDDQCSYYEVPHQAGLALCIGERRKLEWQL